MEVDKKLVSIGNYILFSHTLGEGSFSKVKIAKHKVLDKEVAVKVIASSKIKDEYVKRNLEREVKILSNLHHPQIVRLFEVATCKGFYYIMMEFYSD